MLPACRRALTMPRVTVFCRPSAEPMAITSWPVRHGRRPPERQHGGRRRGRPQQREVDVGDGALDPGRTRAAVVHPHRDGGGAGDDVVVGDDEVGLHEEPGAARRAGLDHDDARRSCASHEVLEADRRAPRPAVRRQRRRRTGRRRVGRHALRGRRHLDGGRARCWGGGRARFGQRGGDGGAETARSTPRAARPWTRARRRRRRRAPACRARRSPGSVHQRSRATTAPGVPPSRRPCHIGTPRHQMARDAHRRGRSDPVVALTPSSYRQRERGATAARRRDRLRA